MRFSDLSFDSSSLWSSHRFGYWARRYFHQCYDFLILTRSDYRLCPSLRYEWLKLLSALRINFLWRWLFDLLISLYRGLIWAQIACVRGGVCVCVSVYVYVCMCVECAFAESVECQACSMCGMSGASQPSSKRKKKQLPTAEEEAGSHVT